MKKLLAVALIIIFACVSVTRAEMTKEKRDEIEKMLRLTGMEKLMDQMMNQVLAGLQKQMPDVPQDFWVKFRQKVDTRELIEKIIPLYDKYYTVEDLKAMNAFYASPAGQKILSTMPQLMQESMKIGQEWGAKLGRQVAEEVQQESKGK